MVTVMVAAVVAVVGLWYPNVQTRQANEQAQQANAQAGDDRALAKEGQITDRYTAAVGNLGEDKVDVRLGGIYALERIMQDSGRNQPTITNVLAPTSALMPPIPSEGARRTWQRSRLTRPLLTAIRICLPRSGSP
ncbi:hypothetical protein OG596_34145 [Streptomyces sp. NBC_01102]|uniref:hypothetical protein n=1 Tax=Streptomyces sp. NBC_01102 TaxID=2903749 RepID=UPI003865BD42|nr:hypothetical protein OG596_34145 [Streptomyces sp. NBC_01102]